MSLCGRTENCCLPCTPCGYCCPPPVCGPCCCPANPMCVPCEPIIVKTRVPTPCAIPVVPPCPPPITPGFVPTVNTPCCLMPPSMGASPGVNAGVPAPSVCYRPPGGCGSCGSCG